MTPYALAAGALLAALAGTWSLAALALLPLVPRGLRLPFALALLAVLGRSLLAGDPWADALGKVQVLEGELRGGVLATARGPIYLDAYPRPADGWVRARGTVRRPDRARLPGGFDRRAWLLGQGVRAELADAEVLAWRPSGRGLRDAVRARLVAGLTPEAAALARAFTLGERGALGDDVEAFRRAGLAHVLALSGLHVGLLVGFFVLLGMPLGTGRYPLALALLVFYLALVGPTPSLVRAGLMAAVWLLARALGYGEVPLSALLALALALHLALDPWAVHGLAFQLSYLAVLGIALALPLVPRVRGSLQWLLGTLAVTLAAQAATLPRVLDAFHRVPLASPLANLAALPLVSLLVPLGFVKALLPADPGGVLAAAFNHLAAALLALVRAFAAGPELRWGMLDASGYALYYLALAPLALAAYRRLPTRSALALAATAALVAAVSADANRPDVWFLDVGQGDAALVRLPGGVEVLVDGGHPWDAARLRRALAALGADELDLVVASHPDADHVGGLPELLRTWPVGALVVGPPAGEALEGELRAAARAAGVPVVTASRGDVLRVGGAELRFLHPPPGGAAGNAGSLVFVLDVGAGGRVLFTGDAPGALAYAWRPEPVRILKVSHHGESGGTTEVLLRRFRPRLAWIGVGRNNPFGHPEAETLARLGAWGVRVWRGDRDGSVRLPLR
ncbi:DNA internalization-related competence protein ComEC/Rec2 [Oceanithermus sp.]|uniref:DNA internalization-related competence protein ComEC/Rec2 n=1 Tax=Oceanithermus sp. TaxID=2268145 RepID=UPI0025D6A599|nr:DNA internalization-related competence protein ComEC/Rec2 [Oceanithermus sp.]